MKKQILFSLLIIAGITTNVFCQQEKNTTHDTKKNAKAFLIQFGQEASVIEELSKKGIPFIHEINGYTIWSWIKYPDWTNSDNVMQNVSIIQQMQDGTFSEAKLLSTFSRDQLANCYDVIEPYKTFAESDKNQYKVYSWRLYSADHLDLVEKLKSDKCVLCKHSNNKQTIVTNAQGSPEKVCNALNLVRQAKIQKKQRESAGK